MKKMTPEQIKLVEENIRLAHPIIGKYYYFCDKYVKEELYSVAYEAMCRAAQSYNPDKSAFSTYATLVIRREIYAYYNRYIKDTELNCEISENLLITAEAGTLSEDTRYEELYNDMCRLVGNCAAKSKSKYFQALNMRLKGMSYEDIAKQLETSTSSIHTLIGYAKAKLKTNPAFSKLIPN